MKNIEQHLTQYAAYHRDQRNIVTHFIGVPVIVFSVVLALAQLSVGPLHAGWIGIGLAGAYYLWLDRSIGLAMLVFLVICGLAASLISSQTGWAVALGLALALFVVGWIIQFVGHRYEGVKPAFTDDVMGLAIGPLFVMAEAFFMAGSKPGLRKYIEDRVGPTVAARDGRLLPMQADNNMTKSVDRVH